jgi:hypothetical protein
MAYRTRIFFSEKQKAEIWDRWQRGESMSSIGRVFDRGFHVKSSQILVKLQARQKAPLFYLLVIWPAQQHGPKVICFLKVGVHRICAHVRCLVQNVALHRSQSICACERALKV